MPMPTPQELEAKFWKAVESDRTMMLGLVGVDGGHTRPMTAQIENGRGPIWFFTSRESDLVAGLAGAQRAFAAFSAKDHDLFATVHGPLRLDNDRAAIDRLWNPFVAAWFDGGKDDPKLALLRFDAEHAEIWLNASSLLAGAKILLGVDPKKDYKDNVADVDLR
jgi:general stress protein 26